MVNRQWYYYYCMHGPGHQSTTDGFFSTEKDATDDDVRDYIEHVMRDHYDVVSYWWKVKNPPQSWLRRRVQEAEARLAFARDELKHLKSQEAAKAPIEDGRDEGIIAAMIGDDTQGGVIRHSLLEILHQKGLYYNDDDIGVWWYGRSKPATSVRRRVMNAIKKADRYPCYKR